MTTSKAQKFEDNKFLQILSDHSESFMQKYTEFDNAYYRKAISDVLNCSDPVYGFRQYMCLHCGKDDRIVAHSCKSKLCLRCGRRGGEEFAASLRDSLHEEVDYRQLVLTSASQIWPIFYWFRYDKDLFNVFFAAANQCVKEFMAEAIGEEVECGCLVVLHTVGRKCDYKPHLHIMLMSGGISKKTGAWMPLEKFPYEILYKCWQRVLLRFLRFWDVLGKYTELFDYLENRYKGFVTNISVKNAPKNSRGLLRYLSKYLCRPQMSLKRLLHYDKNKNEVTYSYNSHSTGRKEIETVSAHTFIGRMLQQILPKGFHRVRYFGLQSPKNRSRLVAKVCKSVGMLELVAEKVKKGKEKVKLYYKDLVEIWWRYNPFSCRHCGEEMQLARVWKKGKGFVYNIFRETFGHDIGPPGSIPAGLAV